MPDLPELDANSWYLFSGATMNAMREALRTYRPCCVERGGLLLAHCGTDGSFIKKVPSGGGGNSSDPGDSIDEYDEEKIYLWSAATKKEFEKYADQNLTRGVSPDITTTQNDDGVTVNST